MVIIQFSTITSKINKIRLIRYVFCMKESDKKSVPALSDSFISCKNASNNPNFIDFGDDCAKLYNYQHYITLTSIF